MEPSRRSDPGPARAAVGAGNRLLHRAQTLERSRLSLALLGTGDVRLSLSDPSGPGIFALVFLSFLVYRTGAGRNLWSDRHLSWLSLRACADDRSLPGHHSSRLVERPALPGRHR